MIYRRRGYKKKGPEARVQSDIIAILRLHHCDVWRMNVMASTYKDRYGKTRFIRSINAGFPDLFGINLKNQKAFFIEVKRPHGGVISPKQWTFHLELMHDKAIHGIAKSVKDALKIVNNELVGYGYDTTRRSRR